MVYLTTFTRALNTRGHFTIVPPARGTKGVRVTIQVQTEEGRRAQATAAGDRQKRVRCVQEFEELDKGVKEFLRLCPVQMTFVKIVVGAEDMVVGVEEVDGERKEVTGRVVIDLRAPDGRRRSFYGSTIKEALGSMIQAFNATNLMADVMREFVEEGKRTQLTLEDFGDEDESEVAFDISLTIRSRRSALPREDIRVVN